MCLRCASCCIRCSTRSPPDLPRGPVNAF
jgi:hypothetical protein